MDHRMTLDYALHPGWMQPFADGLMQGKAIARVCGECDRVSFPPLRVCSCGGRDGTWHQLAGTAGVELRTTGADGDFALAEFNGADTKTVVRLIGFDSGATRGTIIPSPDKLPALCLTPTDQKVDS